MPSSTSARKISKVEAGVPLSVVPHPFETRTPLLQPDDSHNRRLVQHLHPTGYLNPLGIQCQYV